MSKNNTHLRSNGLNLSHTSETPKETGMYAWMESPNSDPKYTKLYFFTADNHQRIKAYHNGKISPIPQTGIWLKVQLQVITDHTQTRCKHCKMTVSLVTYGAYGPNPKKVWKHSGNQYQKTNCKNPTPELPEEVASS